MAWPELAKHLSSSPNGQEPAGKSKVAQKAQEGQQGLSQPLGRGLYLRPFSLAHLVFWDVKCSHSHIDW